MSDSFSPVPLGELLRRHRLEASLTQKQLADPIGYHNSLVSRVERNEQAPQPEYVQAVIQALQLPTQPGRISKARNIDLPSLRSSQYGAWTGAKRRMSASFLVARVSCRN